MLDINICCGWSIYATDFDETWYWQFIINSVWKIYFRSYWYCVIPTLNEFRNRTFLFH
jgi:hypothetical protein